MSQNIKFSKIKFGDRFNKSFKDFNSNNEIKFDINKVAIVYAPNGSGKSSLASVLNTSEKEDGVEYSVEIDGKTVTQDSTDIDNPFFVISDSFLRNFKDRSGESTKDFVMGKNIEEELNLEEAIGEKVKEVNDLKTKLLKKDNFNITAVSDRTFNDCKENVLYTKFISKKEVLLADIKLIHEENVPPVAFSNEEDNQKYEFVKKHYNTKESIIDKILKLDLNSIGESIPEFRKIGIDNDAIALLEKHEVKDCPFDTSESPHAINMESIKEALETNLDENLNKLPSNLRDEVQYFFNYSNSDEDLFDICNKVKEAFERGNKSIIDGINEEIKDLAGNIINELLNFIKTKIVESSIMEDIDRLDDLHSQELNLGEDEELLRQLISSMLGCDVMIERDENSRISFKINNISVAGTTHDEFPFSTGEKNFVSLYLELLLAKNSDKEIVVLDDPISSFDSIYKNKIIYAIMHILKDKKVIILTHNLDTIRLSHHQCGKGYYKLYVLANTTNHADNGFVEVSMKEKENIISISETIKTLRKLVNNEGEIEDKKAFALSIIPFIRDYSKLLIKNNNDDSDSDSERSDVFNNLTNAMHGYKAELADVTRSINEVIDVNIQDKDSSDIKISGAQVADREIPNTILKEGTDYPLLDKILKQNLTFMILRNKVEKAFYDSDKNIIDKMNSKDGKGLTLQKIIDSYIPHGSESCLLKIRSMLLSRKTLLNEFSHFEGNMSLFLPGLDISQDSIENEIKAIIGICKEINGGVVKRA